MVFAHIILILLDDNSFFLLCLWPSTMTSRHAYSVRELWRSIKSAVFDYLAAFSLESGAVSTARLKRRKQSVYSEVEGAYIKNPWR